MASSLVAFNVAVVALRFRGYTRNQLPVWRCERNDAIVNIAVILAGIGVAQQRSTGVLIHCGGPRAASVRWRFLLKAVERSQSASRRLYQSATLKLGVLSIRLASIHPKPSSI